MPYADNGGLRIHYEELGGEHDLPPLVLVFGFGMTVLDWVDLGYVEALKDAFRLIAIEPRGHGTSDGSTNPDDYRLDLLASDVIAVMNHLAIEKAIVGGYSLGAKIVLSLASRHPQRLAGLVLGGFEFASEVRIEDDLVIDSLRKGGPAWRDLWRRMMDLPPAMAERLLQANTGALIALREAEGCWESLADAVHTIDVPCLLYAGEHCLGRNAVRAAASSIASSRYVELAGLTHFQVLGESAWICSEVRRFFA
ncbi:Hydrolase, alpha/beta hydrolase fold family [Labilithrix luteola]|uniref:Hydrolase, alpha/beta hydrolase fold family n=1 Tax=Labilithrix luteola TaxID=1391654 RepID=A0A0K1PXW1_9BACT|nr:alpha/beta hydrolase [Labilithrix luteola]AKU98368.1 Hydrolase, alpha/beta hydrolase fold family [Labilithrix luteola]